MLKKFLMFAIFVAICFLLPAFFIDYKHISAIANEKGVTSSGENEMAENNTEKIENIRLLLTATNQVVELSFDDYIKGVLVGEVPIKYEKEALKAQAIVARTYTLYKLKNNPSAHENADMCDDINCCQAYRTKEYAFASWNDSEELEKWQKLESAVEETKNMVITYEGEIIEAFFHAHSGGKTENVKYVWSGVEIPYLQSVESNEGYTYTDTKTFTKSEFKELLKSDVPNYDEKSSKIEIIDYTGSGRVNNLKIADTEIKATKLRSLLKIRSTNFRIEEKENEIIFYTVGYGHGVGMSQEGANQMALNGKSVEEIIKHYYVGTKIELLKQ